MRPDRIIVGEVRQEECLDLLISLNSGLPGMCTVDCTRWGAPADERLRRLDLARCWLHCRAAKARRAGKQTPACHDARPRLRRRASRLATRAAFRRSAPSLRASI